MTISKTGQLELIGQLHIKFFSPEIFFNYDGHHPVNFNGPLKSVFHGLYNYKARTCIAKNEL